MKKLSLLISMLLITVIIFAQSPLGKGGKQLNAGVGFSGWGIPVYVGFDYGVHKDITVGLEGSFRSYHDNWNGNKYSHSIMGIFGNGNYHFNSILGIPKKWDLYAGLNLGFYMWTSSGEYKGDHSSGLGWGGQLGGRYYFSDALGLNLEFGGGNSYGGKIGISYKF